MDRSPDRDKRMESNKTFDLDSLLNRVAGDTGLLQEMVDIFIADLPGRLSEIERALASGHREELERTVHNLKGSIGYFTSAAAYQAANTLVEMARTDQLDGADEIFAVLKQEADRLESAMIEWKKRNSTPDTAA